MNRPAERLMAALEADPMARLKWRVLTLLGVNPLSLRARLVTRRQVLRCACHLVLDMAPGAPERGGGSLNPAFDMARFEALGGRSDGV